MSLLYSLIISLLLAVSYFLSNLIFKLGNNFEKAMALAALRASYTIPIKLVASILGLLSVVLGIPVFFMSSLLASPLISASLYSGVSLNNDKVAKASMLVRFLFIIIFIALAPKFLNSAFIDNARGSINSLINGSYGL